MSKPRLDDEDFARMFQTHGTADMAKALNLNERSINRRRRNVESKLGVILTSPSRTRSEALSARIELDLEDGQVLVGSDAHYWPGEATTGHRAFVKFARELQPNTIVLNGDVIIGATISRFPPIGWEDNPTVSEELEVCQERLGEIALASPRSRRIWPLGNHDARFETRLATVAPEYAHVHGVHLKDHFPDWEPCWSVFVGGPQGAVIKHRYKGGTHATHNNALWSGRSIVTGHLHSLNVRALTDYNGTRWGVDCGTLAEPTGPQFMGWTEDNPVNWRQGFILLTWKAGRLLWPEIISVVEPGLVNFRGELIDV